MTSDDAATPAAESGESAATAESAAPAIEADRLSKYYGQFTAVEDVSFSVPRGSITAFLGPNGAGKSTTMKILTGFLAPSAGRARIAGHNVAEDRLAASRVLGYLPENGPLYHDMTPAAFLRFAARVRGLDGEAQRAAIERVVDRCRLAEVWHKPIRKLSKGFRQRVCLAQAIIHDPEVLILDEPTSGLDPNQVEMARELIRELANRKTVLLSTHILREVEAMADRVVLISEGRIAFTGSPAELAGDEGMEARFHALTKGVAA